MIVRALGEMQDREAIPGLIGLLSNPKLQVRVSAAHALEQMPDESAVEPLMKNVEEWWSWTEQQFATQAFLSALVATRDKRVPDLLVRLTKAHRISFATSPTGSFIVPQEQGKPDRIGNQIGSSPLGSALVSFGPRALPAIEKGLASEHAATREVCAWAVHELLPASADRVVLEYDPDPVGPAR